jgi:hypothetical protein
MRGGAGAQRHVDAVAGVVAGAPHLGEIPVGAEVLGAPQHVGVEAAGGKHHGFRVQRALAAFAFNDDVPAVRVAF